MGHAALSYRIAGTEQANVVIDKRTVVGPASYTQGTGLAVDLSAVFTTLIAVRLLRAYVTSSLAADTRIYAIHEAGSDTFANRKFRALAYRATAPTTNTNATAVAASTITGITGVLFGGTLTGSCVVGCDTDHPNGVGAVNDMLQATSPSQITVVTGLVAPTTALTEVDAATNLSTITLEYEAVGVV